MKIKYIIGESRNPYKNLAIERELMNHALPGTMILFLWQNDNTVVIGRHQNLFSECKVQEFVGSGGVIARRFSGGGAVYHDLGNLNFSIITMESEKDTCPYYEIISKALKRFSVKCEHNGRNDVLVMNRKISGNAEFIDDGVACQHGTILIECNLDKMEYYLTPDISKLERNKVTSVGARVINLAQVDSKISVSSMKEAMIMALNAEKLNYSPNDTLIDKYEQLLSDNLWITQGKI